MNETKVIIITVAIRVPVDYSVDDIEGIEHHGGWIDRHHILCSTSQEIED